MSKIKYGFRSEDEKEFPSMVHLETNNICNIKCIHCPQSDLSKLPDYKPQSMGFEIFKKITDEVAENDSILRLTNDGEPLIHKNMVDMVEHVYDKKVRIFTFNTNGLLLEGKILDSILKLSNTLVSIEVSLDAFYKKTYEKIRVGSDYNRVLRNIFDFVYSRDKKKLDNIKIVTSIIDQPEAIEEMDIFKEFWSQVVDDVIIRKYVSTKDLLEMKNQEYDTNIERWPCLLPFRRIVVGPDGKVRFCPDDWKKESVIGDVNDGSLKDLWQGEKYSNLRRIHLEGKWEEIVPCNYCKEWQVLKWDYDYQHALDKLFRNEKS